MNRFICGVLGVLALGGCALFSKAEVPSQRFFSLENREVIKPNSTSATKCELRLGRVTAPDFMTERIMFRKSPHEVGYYDDQLWTEKPQESLRRELSRVLFEEYGLRSLIRGAGPVLDVELIRFEEVKEKPHLARIELALSLSNERVSLLQQTITVDKPIENAKANDEGLVIANAMGLALRDIVQQLAERVVSNLGKIRNSSDGCQADSASPAP